MEVPSAIGTSVPNLALGIFALCGRGWMRSLDYYLTLQSPVFPLACGDSSVVTVAAENCLLNTRDHLFPKTSKFERVVLNWFNRV